jgi:hypothetical protein
MDGDGMGRGGYGAWALTAAVLALVACAPRPFSKPEIVAGGEKTVTIKAGQWSNTDTVANAYCEAYGKRAVARGRKRLNETDLTDLYVYDCISGHK